MVRNQEIKEVEIANNTVLIALNLFWLGVIFYVASFTISNTELVNYIICNVFQILGLLLLVPSAVILIRFKIESKYLKVIFPIYFFWLMIVVIRGIEFDYLSIKGMLLGANLGILPYLVPLIIFFPKDLIYLKRVFNVILILGIIFIIYDMIFLKQLLFPFNSSQSQAIIEYFSQHLSIPGGFLLLTFLYHSKKKNILFLFIIVFTFVIAVFRARRTLMLMSFSILIFSYLIYQYANKRKIINTILSLLIISFVSFFSVKVYNTHRKDTFSLITERIRLDTRSEVERYFYEDLKTIDWIIGKGMNGEYFCPGVNEGVGRISFYRKVIETGYLQVILNGGVINLVLLLLITVPAFIKGLFYSKNILSKAAGIWILLFMLFMYPGTLTIFSLHYILVWISIGICYSDKISNMTEENIKTLFAGRKFISTDE